MCTFPKYIKLNMELKDIFVSDNLVNKFGFTYTAIHLKRISPN